MKTSSTKQRNIRLHKKSPNYETYHRNGVSTSPEDRINQVIYVNQAETQQIFLPHTEFTYLPGFKKEGSAGINKKQINFKRNLISGGDEDKNKTKVTTNVHNFYEMNNKYRKIRNSQYKFNNSAKINNLIMQQKMNSLTTSPTLRNHQNMTNCRMILTAVGKKRSLDSLKCPQSHSPSFFRKYYEDNDLNPPQQVTQRPATVQNVRRHNPLVIYPLETKLKSKRLSDNQKIFKNMIKKRQKVMQRDGLQIFLNKIINGKPQ